MWIRDSSLYLVDISTPGRTARPIRRPASRASVSPSNVSWSHSPMTSRPASWAAYTSRVGLSVPSETFEWTCRSMRMTVFNQVTGRAPTSPLHQGPQQPHRHGQPTEIGPLEGQVCEQRRDALEVRPRTVEGARHGLGTERGLYSK